MSGCVCETHTSRPEDPGSLDGLEFGEHVDLLASPQVYESAV